MGRSQSLSELQLHSRSHVIVVAREEFLGCAKTCNSFKDYLDKVAREGKTSGLRVDTVREDQASLAFRAIDKDNSGYVDRKEFLQFTR